MKTRNSLALVSFFCWGQHAERAEIVIIFALDLILVLIKNLEKIFIAPQVRSELYETGNCTIVQFQRAKHAVFLIK